MPVVFLYVHNDLKTNCLWEFNLLERWRILFGKPQVS